MYNSCTWCGDDCTYPLKFLNTSALRAILTAASTIKITSVMQMIPKMANSPAVPVVHAVFLIQSMPSTLGRYWDKSVTPPLWWTTESIVSAGLSSSPSFGSAGIAAVSGGCVAFAAGSPTGCCGRDASARFSKKKRRVKYIQLRKLRYKKNPDRRLYGPK